MIKVQVLRILIVIVFTINSLAASDMRKYPLRKRKQTEFFTSGIVNENESNKKDDLFLMIIIQKQEKVNFRNNSVFFVLEESQHQGSL
jgi:hypothetical protein